jgi:[acyl-carrier-protein] S-malonyltransferase
MVKDFGIKRGILLPVSAPFHCPLMAPAAEAMAEALAAHHPAAPMIPLFANVTAAPTSEPSEIERLLVEQVTGRVRWRESGIAMAAAGVTHFTEVGGKVVGPMVKKVAPDAGIDSIVTMADVEAFLKALG